MNKHILFERVTVTFQPLIEEIETPDGNIITKDATDHLAVLPEGYNPTVMDMLEMMAHLPLRDQVFMMANLLTISGYEQKEIAKAMGVAYQTYRNHIWGTRKALKEQGITSI